MQEMPASIEAPPWADPMQGSAFWTIGERIRFSRKRAGLTQGELAELTWIGDPFGYGIKSPSVSDYERDEARPSAQAIAAIAWVLNVSADFLVGLTNEPRALRGDTPFAASRSTWTSNRGVHQPRLRLVHPDITPSVDLRPTIGR